MMQANDDSLAGESAKQQDSAAVSPNGRYLYCVVELAGEPMQPMITGIDGQPVYAVPFQDIAVLAHNCKAQLYNAPEESQLIDWVLCHEKVIETAMGNYPNVLPFAFNTIVHSKHEEQTATDCLLQWIDQNYSRLKSKLGKVRGKKEYIIKIFMDCRLAASELMNTDHELKALQNEANNSPRGKAFLLKGKIQSLLNKKMADAADKFFHELFNNITRITSEYHAGKIKPVEKDQLMLLNLSCLADGAECEQLGNILDEITQSQAVITVNFSGPWPPYSFV